ncbi:hypothetical protein ACOMHN_049516 [Nucella lapillus]
MGSCVSKPQESSHVHLTQRGPSMSWEGNEKSSGKTSNHPTTNDVVLKNVRSHNSGGSLNNDLAVDHTKRSSDKTGTSNTTNVNTTNTNACLSVLKDSAGPTKENSDPHQLYMGGSSSSSSSRLPTLRPQSSGSACSSAAPSAVRTTAAFPPYPLAPPQTPTLPDTSSLGSCVAQDSAREDTTQDQALQGGGESVDGGGGVRRSSSGGGGGGGGGGWMARKDSAGSNGSQEKGSGGGGGGGEVVVATGESGSRPRKKSTFRKGKGKRVRAVCVSLLSVYMSL